MDLKSYITEAAWQQRMNVKEYISALIRADMYAKQGDKPQ